MEMFAIWLSTSSTLVWDWQYTLGKHNLTMIPAGKYFVILLLCLRAYGYFKKKSFIPGFWWPSLRLVLDIKGKSEEGLHRRMPYSLEMEIEHAVPNRHRSSNGVRFLFCVCHKNVEVKSRIATAHSMRRRGALFQFSVHYGQLPVGWLSCLRSAIEKSCCGGSSLIRIMGPG